MDADHRPPHEGRPSEGEQTPTPEEPERRRRGNRHHAYRRKNRARKGAPRGDGAKKAARADATGAQMRAARASGRTPGISTADEPAAAPLGTDDEAAGTPPRSEDLEVEIERAQSGRGMHRLDASEAMSGRPGRPETSPFGLGKLVAIGAAIVILIMLAVLLF